VLKVFSNSFLVDSRKIWESFWMDFFFLDAKKWFVCIRAMAFIVLVMVLFTEVVDGTLSDSGDVVVVFEIQGLHMG